MLQRFRSAWFLLFILPLYFLCLDQYPLLMSLWAGPAADPPVPQLILPRVLPPDQPYHLYGSLTTRHARAHPVSLDAVLSSARETRRWPVHTRSDGGFELTLPALPTGAYQFYLAFSGGEALSVPTLLRVHAPRVESFLLEPRQLLPGATLALRLRAGMARSASPLEIRLKQQQRIFLQQTVIPTAAGMVSTLVSVPQEVQPGEARLELYQGENCLASEGLLILDASSAVVAREALQVRPVLPTVLRGVSQAVLLSFHDQAGQPLTSGWLRHEGRELPVHNGYARLTLRADQLGSRPEITAGDGHGHLKKMRLPLEIRDRGLALQPILTAEGKLAAAWQVCVRQPDRLLWAWGQERELLGQTQTTLRAGCQRLDWPLDVRPRWFVFQLRSEPQPIWLQALPRSSPLSVEFQPVRPDALSHFQLRLTGLPAEAFPLEVETLISHTGSGGAEALRTQPVPAFTLPPRAFFFSWRLAWASTLYWMILIGLNQLFFRWFLQRLKGLPRQLPASPLPMPAVNRGGLKVLLRFLLIAWGFVLLVLGVWVLTRDLSGLRWLPVLPVLVLSLVVTGLIRWLTKYQAFKYRKQTSVWLLIWFFSSLLLIWALYTWSPLLVGGGWLIWAFDIWLLYRQLCLLCLPTSVLRTDHSLAWTLSTLVLFALVQVPALPRFSLPLSEQPSPFVWQERGAPEPLLFPIRLEQQTLLTEHAQLSLAPTFSAGQHQLQLAVTDRNRQSHFLAVQTVFQPAVLPALSGPAYALVGDQIQLRLMFRNQFSKPQTLRFRLKGQNWQELALAAGEERFLWQPFFCQASEWQTLTLEQEWQGRVVRREHRLYVLPQEPEQANARLQLQLEAPVREGLVVGQEIPVKVSVSQHSGTARALGLQLGIPAGFVAFTDTLNDRQVAGWLTQVRKVPGYVQIQTRPLPSGQPLSFHYRLRVLFPGQVSTLPSRLFWLEEPQQALVTAAEPVFTAAVNP